MGLPGGVVLASRREPCEVCPYPKMPGKPLYLWKPAAAEKDMYKTVWVHPGCRERLLRGERPDDVRRLGLTESQAYQLVCRCEALRVRPSSPSEPAETWAAYQALDGADPFRRPLKRELRAARGPHADKLQLVTEAAGASAASVLTFRNLSHTIDYMVANDIAIASPIDVVETLRDLQRRDRLHHLHNVPDGSAPDYDPF